MSKNDTAKVMISILGLALYFSGYPQETKLIGSIIFVSAFAIIYGLS